MPIAIAIGVAAIRSTLGYSAVQKLSSYVEVHGQRLWLDCTGRGSPTVVFEAAAGSDSTEWVSVQPSVGKEVRACAYDRLGEGRSDAVRAGVLETADSDARILHELLRAAHISPPYVLVGHSWGGGMVERFANDYGSETKGMVLVDSQQADVIGQWLAMLPPVPTSGSDPFAPVRAELKQALDPTSDPTEHFDVPVTITQLRAVHSLGSMPLVVLSAGTSQIAGQLPPSYGARSYRIWAAAQAKLAALSTRSVDAVDTFSQHFVPTRDPAAVVAATEAVVDAVRGRGALARCGAIFAHVTGVRCD